MTIFRKRNGPGASGAMQQSVEEKAVQIPKIQTEPKPVRPSTPTRSKRRRTNVNPPRNTIGLLARTMRESDLLFSRDSRQHLPTCTIPLLLPVARAWHLLTKVAIPLSTCCLTQCAYCQRTVCKLSGSVCMLSMCSTHVALCRVHAV
jgi:hypothetical protein